MNELEPTSHRFISQRLALHYLNWGNSDAPLLILIHGGRDHARSWDWLARALRQDWHVICPDLRGHGDSAWSPDGCYTMPSYVSDFAQLIDQLGDGPVSIVGHSLGGATALRYAGLYPERVRRLAVIEGLGSSPLDHESEAPVAERWRNWIEERRTLSVRAHPRYTSLDQAYVRMSEANPHLSAERLHHLTLHGTIRNEDGTYSWKFDNYVRCDPPTSIAKGELYELWHNVDCPVWLIHGADSWARHPGKDGRAGQFKQASVTSYPQAGHWAHHDRFDSFVVDLKIFLEQHVDDQSSPLSPGG